MDADVAHHGMFNTEVNAFLVRVDADLDSIVNAPTTRQGWSCSGLCARTS